MNELSFLSPAKRRAFQSALDHYFNGDPRSFLLSSANAVIAAYNADERILAPLRFEHTASVETELDDVLNRIDSR
jgi:hypothetical protein